MIGESIPALLVALLTCASALAVMSAWARIKRKTGNSFMAVGQWACALLLCGMGLPVVLFLLGWLGLLYAAPEWLLELITTVFTFTIGLGLLGNVASFMVLAEMIIEGEVKAS